MYSLSINLIQMIKLKNKNKKLKYYIIQNIHMKKKLIFYILKMKMQNNIQMKQVIKY